MVVRMDGGDTRMFLEAFGYDTRMTLLLRYVTIMYNYQYFFHGRSIREAYGFLSTQRLAQDRSATITTIIIQHSMI